MSKTYGEVLTDETVKRINYRWDSDGYHKAQDEIARAVILEFVKRVEERAEEYELSGYASLYEAFHYEAKELKEAK